MDRPCPLPAPYRKPARRFVRSPATVPRYRLLRKTMMLMRSRLLLPCWHAWNDLTQTAKIARAAAQQEEERARRGSIYSTSTRSINLSMLDNFTTFS